MRIGIDASRAFVNEPTGTERYSLEMIKHILMLPEAGRFDWTLFVKANQLDKVDAFLSGKTNVRVIEIPLRRLWTQVGLALKTWTSEIDLLWVPAHTLPVFRKPGVKTVVTIHGIEYEWLPAYESVLQRWYLPLSTQYAVKTASRIVAVSEFTKKQLVERLGAEEKKISVVYEGYTANSKLEYLNSKQILNIYNLKSKQYIIFVGTVQPRKNLVRLIEAFAHLTPTPLLTSGEGLKMVIVGKLGWMYEEVLEKIKALGLQDCIVMTGYVSDAERYSLLHNAMFYVQSSITEGFGLPILEAWQAGLAVVSSNGGALKEVVGKAGLLFEPTDVADMKKAMEKMLDKEVLFHYEQLGKERLKDFSWKDAVVNVLELFRTYSTI